MLSSLVSLPRFGSSVGSSSAALASSSRAGSSNASWSISEASSLWTSSGAPPGSSQAPASSDVAVSSGATSGVQTQDVCSPSAILSLDVLGTRVGLQTSFVGDNTLGGPALGSPCGYAPTHVVAFQYTVQTLSRLVVSTYHAATTPGLDTLVWAQAGCGAAAPVLGCSDDVTAAQSRRTPAPPAGHEHQSMFTTLSPDPGMLAPNTVVYIFVGGYAWPAGSPNLTTGSFLLTVTEVAPPFVYDSACDPAAVPPLCEVPLSCVAGGTDLSDYSCATMCATARCAAGQGCSTRSACVPMAPAYDICDLAGIGNVCATKSRCGRMNGVPRCLPPAALGGKCCGSAPPWITAPVDCGANAPACDNNLWCAEVVNVCVAPDPGAGIVCNIYSQPTATECDMTAQCMAGVGGGGLGTCFTYGALGGRCVAFDSANFCQPGLVCVGSICQTALAAGAACGPTTAYCGSGLVCVAGRCEAHGYIQAGSVEPWVDACHAAGAVRLLAGGVLATANVTLPFRFSYFGEDIRARSVGMVTTWGTLLLPGTSYQAGAPSVPPPAVLPSQAMDNGIYPLWMYMTFQQPQTGGSSASSVCVATLGASPTRTLVVEWDHAGYVTAAATGDGATFELQIKEANGQLDFLYSSFTGNEFQGDVFGGKATVGLESTHGTSLVQVCASSRDLCTPAKLQNTRFTPTP